MNGRQRPFLVTLLAVVVLLLSTVNLIAAVTAVTRSTSLRALDLSLPIPVIVGHTALWGGVWLVLSVGLWRLVGWARPTMMLAFPLYEIMTIGLRIIFAQGAYERGRLPFIFFTGVAAIGAVLLILTRPRIKDAFSRPDNADNDLPEEL